jgi:hypothetical protein
MIIEPLGKPGDGGDYQVYDILDRGTLVAIVTAYGDGDYSP